MATHFQIALLYPIKHDRSNAGSAGVVSEAPLLVLHVGAVDGCDCLRAAVSHDKPELALKNLEHPFDARLSIHSPSTEAVRGGTATVRMSPFLGSANFPL